MPNGRLSTALFSRCAVTWMASVKHKCLPILNFHSLSPTYHQTNRSAHRPIDPVIQSKDAAVGDSAGGWSFFRFQGERRGMRDLLRNALAVFAIVFSGRC